MDGEVMCPEVEFAIVIFSGQVFQIAVCACVCVCVFESRVNLPISGILLCLPPTALEFHVQVADLVCFVIYVGAGD